jgi:hypothetical protein
MGRLDFPNSCTIAGGIAFSHDGKMLLAPLESKGKHGIYLWRLVDEN